MHEDGREGFLSHLEKGGEGLHRGHWAMASASETRVPSSVVLGTHKQLFLV